MKIEAFPRVPEAIEQSVRALETICKAHDHLAGKLYLDPSLNMTPETPILLVLYEEDTLSGAMSFFAPTSDEAEIVSLTHPSYRNRGIFRALTTAAAEHAKALGIPDLLFVCEQQSADGLLALKAMGTQPDHIEYALRYNTDLPPNFASIPAGLTLHRAKEADLGALIRISSESFSEEPERAEHFMTLALTSETRKQYFVRLNGEPVGIGSLGYEGDEATIYGLGVLTNLQNKGIGRGIVALLLQEMLSKGTKDILIEVDSTNPRALHLYRTSGFEPEAIYHYFRAPVQQFLSK